MQTRLAAGTVIDQRYEIVELLGQGRSGTVYSASDKQLTRNVAIKMLNLALLQDKDLITRFMREARILASIDHKNILRCFDLVLESKNGSYLVTELVDGASLAQILEQHGRIAVGDAIDIICQVCDGTEFLRTKQLVHRDIKPSNIMIDVLNPDKSVKIIDFGLVGFGQLIEGVETFKLTKPDVVLGTPAFMSPEQIRGQLLDHRSDIYSIGCVLYELLTGEKVAAADTALDTMVMQLTRKPKPLSAYFESSDLPIEELQQVLQLALEKDPDRRYQKASDFRDALAEIGDKTALRLGSSKCRICGRPQKEPVANSSITGWIFSCVCGQIVPPPDSTRFCNVCGKIVEESRAGSFTQWLFKSNRCSCDGIKAVSEPIGQKQDGSAPPSKGSAAPSRTNQSTIGDIDTTAGERLELEEVGTPAGSAPDSNLNTVKGRSLLVATLIVCTLLAAMGLFLLQTSNTKNPAVQPSHRITLKKMDSVNDFLNEYERPPFRLYMTEGGQWEAQGLDVNDDELAKLRTEVEQFAPIVQARKENRIVTGKVKVNSALMNGSGLTNLKDLNVNWLDLSNSSVTDQGLDVLKDFPLLVHLSIRKADKLTCDVGDSLCKIPNLKVLKISGRGITVDALSKMSKLPQLEELSIGELPIGSADIETLSKCKRLKFIEFEKCVLDSSAYEKLSRWRNLQWVRFTKTKTDPKGLSLLHKSGKF